MALVPFILGGIDIFDPFNFDSVLFGRSGGSGKHGRSSYARDVVAVANTQAGWKETRECYIFKANLLGLAKEDVKVQVEDGHVLRISGERKKERTTSSGAKWHRAERAQGSFLRRFRLPDNAKVKEVNASMQSGVLTVTVPKVQLKPVHYRTVQIHICFHLNAKYQDAGRGGLSSCPDKITKASVPTHTHTRVLCPLWHTHTYDLRSTKPPTRLSVEWLLCKPNVMGSTLARLM